MELKWKGKRYENEQKTFQNGHFLPGKIIFHAGKLTLFPLKNIPLMPVASALEFDSEVIIT